MHYDCNASPSLLSRPMEDAFAYNLVNRRCRPDIMNPNILLITDRADLAKLQAQMLVHSGIDVSLLSHLLIQNKTDLADLEAYDLILINLFDAGRVYLEICRKLRAGYNNPILVMIYERDERSQLRT